MLTGSVVHGGFSVSPNPVSRNGELATPLGIVPVPLLAAGCIPVQGQPKVLHKFAEPLAHGVSEIEYLPVISHPHSQGEVYLPLLSPSTTGPNQRKTLTRAITIR